LRVLIAPQEFKGTLSAAEAASAIAAGVHGAFPDWQLDLAPMADGGPGTTEALISGLGGELRSESVHDPLMRPAEATWGLLGGGAAVIECAAASGLWRLSSDELDPRRASSFGAGELIRAALDAGCRELLAGLGGSATNDGGAGMAQALGFRLLDSGGRELPPGGAALAHLARIDASSAHPAIETATVTGATDVTNPLVGPQGASAVYGPQKGAGAAAVAELDAALAHFADIAQRDLGVDVRDIPGAGAAGGLGAGLIAFLGAKLQPGAAVVAAALRLESRVRDADIVFTGEGRLDGQTAFGKAPQYVGRLGVALGKPVVCLAGSLGPGHEALLPLFRVVEPLRVEDGPETDDAASSLAGAAVRAVLRLLSGGGDARAGRS
jgi:glycerate kinase